MKGEVELYHEMPLQMLLQGYEDKLGISGHYALVHLYEKHKEYFEYSIQRLKQGRPVILDNSIFELGTAFDADRFAFWIKELVKYAGKGNVNRNLLYIIPDVLDDYEGTVSQAKNFLQKYEKLPGKKMAVAQGKTCSELLHCYQELNSLTNLDRTGISFNCEAYTSSSKDSCAEDNYDDWETTLKAWGSGRIRFINTLLESYKELSELPSRLHLLGCSLPQEFKYYKGMDAIASVDTSNPVVHGIKGIAYTQYGLVRKESIKLADLFETSVTTPQLDLIEWNTTVFRWFING